MRTAKDTAERRAAFRTRYEVYVEEMGWETEFADHAAYLLEQPLDPFSDIRIAPEV